MCGLVTRTDTFSFPVAQQPKPALGRLIVEVSRSYTPPHTHTHTHTHTVGLLWTRDLPVAETPT
jgi:hypothetical protein